MSEVPLSHTPQEGAGRPGSREQRGSKPTGVPPSVSLQGYLRARAYRGTSERGTPVGSGTAKIERAARKCAWSPTARGRSVRWTGLAPWEFELPFPGSLTSTFLVRRQNGQGGEGSEELRRERFPPDIWGNLGELNTGRCYRGTSLIRDSAPLGPYSRTLAATWRQRYCTPQEGAGRPGWREQRGSAPGAALRRPTSCTPRAAPACITGVPRS